MKGLLTRQNGNNMEKEINIAELLRDCPNGMPLDCAMWDNLYFNRVEDDMIYCYYELDGYKTSTIFCKNGCYSEHKLSKCVIFPKGKTTWEGFEPPVKFKDGDIAATKSGLFVGIVKIENRKQSTYCSIGSNGFVIGADFGFERLANEKEKQKLFDAINENGYIWYPDTKSLVKLFKPNFKVGDRIRNKTDKYLAERNIASYVEGIGYFTTINDWVRITDQDNWELVPIKPIFKVGDIIKCKNGTSKLIVMCIKDDKYIVDDDMGGKCGILCFSSQDNWELVKNIKPIFKVGDRIKLKGGDEFGIITEVADCFYTIKNKNHTHCWPIKKQDNWELVHNKFDITTLKPFDKVLVRTKGFQDTWIATFFSHKDTYEFAPFWATSGKNYQQCIPYEGNEHLLGTTNDCDKYYKTWK